MKILFSLILAFGASCAMAVPMVGNRVSYEVRIQKGTGPFSRPLIFHSKITKFDDKQNVLTVWDQFEGSRGHHDPVPLSVLEPFGPDIPPIKIFDNCAQLNGKYEPVKVPAGFKNACRIQMANGTIVWYAQNVPVQWKYRYIDSGGNTAVFSLRSYSWH